MLNQHEMGRHLTLVPLPERLHTALSIAHGAALRVSEVANLKVSDIDSKSMLVTGPG